MNNPSTVNCNDPPVVVCDWKLPDDYEKEVMNYLYYPVKLNVRTLRYCQFPEDSVYEKRLDPFVKLIEKAFQYEVQRGMGMDDLAERYVYLTAKTMYVGPGITGNRPGWHCDGFGTDDITHVWCDSSPTLFSRGQFNNITNDHNESLKQFDEIAEANEQYEVGVNKLVRLTVGTVRHTPKVWVPALRTFVKISFSRYKYNLAGNTRNYNLDYKWKMYQRSEIRNDVTYANTDYGPQED